MSCNASRRWENAGKGRGREGSKWTRLQNSLSRASSCSMGLILALLSLMLHRVALRAPPQLREVHLSRWGCQVCLSDLVECWLRHKLPAPKSHLFLDTCLAQKDILNQIKLKAYTFWRTCIELPLKSDSKESLVWPILEFFLKKENSIHGGQIASMHRKATVSVMKIKLPLC